VADEDFHLLDILEHDFPDLPAGAGVEEPEGQAREGLRDGQAQVVQDGEGGQVREQAGNAGEGVAQQHAGSRRQGQRPDLGGLHGTGLLPGDAPGEQAQDEKGRDGAQLRRQGEDDGQGHLPLVLRGHAQQARKAAVFSFCSGHRDSGRYSPLETAPADIGSQRMELCETGVSSMPIGIGRWGAT
jgi:hypothetical protein